MLKLMKYEFRKMRLTLGVMLLALVALEIGFLVGDATRNATVIGVSLGLMMPLAFAVYVYILVAGIASYSRELNDKTGYLTFMTPVSPAGIVASKLVFTIVAALAAAALFGAALYFDFSQLFKRFGGDPIVYRQAGFMIEAFFRESGADLTQLALNLCATAASVVIGILTLMCTAYLAITISATLLQNRRGFVRGLVSLILFAALQWLASWASSRFVGAPQLETITEAAQYLGVNLAVDGAFCVLYGGAAAVMLDRKVSL